MLDECRAQRPPHITTLFGRTRRVPGIQLVRARHADVQRAPGVQLPDPGRPADIIKLAMVRLAPTMPEWMKLHLTVHDELVCSAPVDLSTRVEASF